jgi:hypothetical protein
MRQYVQMARISGDFWDQWKSLQHMFELCVPWIPHIGNGFWMDCDMLPMGMIGLPKGGGRGPDRASRFTHGEQQLMMTLWAICRSPLFLGGDVALLDDATLALLTNPEVLAVNQGSSGNRQLFRRGDRVAWVASAPGESVRYLALFNLAGDGPAEIEVADPMTRTYRMIIPIAAEGQRHEIPRLRGLPKPGLPEAGGQAASLGMTTKSLSSRAKSRDLCPWENGMSRNRNALSKNLP